MYPPVPIVPTPLNKKSVDTSDVSNAPFTLRYAAKRRANFGMVIDRAWQKATDGT